MRVVRGLVITLFYFISRKSRAPILVFVHFGAADLLNRACLCINQGVRGGADMHSTWTWPRLSRVDLKNRWR
ncbi:hypothetical protein RSAG8_03755, partial [Rhizoctonia solani AG-8 WAC10335]